MISQIVCSLCSEYASLVSPEDVVPELLHKYAVSEKLSLTGSQAIIDKSKGIFKLSLTGSEAVSDKLEVWRGSKEHALICHSYFS